VPIKTSLVNNPWRRAFDLVRLVTLGPLDNLELF